MNANQYPSWWLDVLAAVRQPTNSSNPSTPYDYTPIPPFEYNSTKAMLFWTSPECHPGLTPTLGWDLTLKALSTRIWVNFNTSKLYFRSCPRRKPQVLHDTLGHDTLGTACTLFLTITDNDIKEGKTWKLTNSNFQYNCSATVNSHASSQDKIFAHSQLRISYIVTPNITCHRIAMRIGLTRLQYTNKYIDKYAIRMLTNTIWPTSRTLHQIYTCHYNGSQRAELAKFAQLTTKETKTPDSSRGNIACGTSKIWTAIRIFTLLPHDLRKNSQPSWPTWMLCHVA